MKIVFVQSVSENFAVEIFSSLLKGLGHECYLVYDRRLFNSGEIQNRFLFNALDIRDNLVNEIEVLKPDLIAFSVLTDQYQWALDMARRIKKRMATPIIFGGVHVTMVPEEVISNNCVDIICIGEGEQAIVELAERIADARLDYNIQNLWFKKEGRVIKNRIRPLISDLNTLPFPDKVMFYDKEPSIAGHYAITSGRGCPFSCTYCASDVIKRLSCSDEVYVRKRSPQNVIDELLYAKNKLKFNFKTVNFIDDVFTYDYDWLSEFCLKYKKDINLPFHCTGYPNTINYEKASLLKGAGCFRIGMGIQSVSENTRKNILNRPGTNEQIMRAAKSCRDAGLSFWFDHILNIPYETEEEQIQALRFYNEARPPIINVFWLIYYPKTKIVDIAKEANLLDEETIERINRGQASTSMVVGIGGEYSFAKERVFSNFAFLFHLLPLIPKKWMDRIIEKRMFMGPRFKVPVLVNVFIKFLIRLRLGRAVESLWFMGILIKGTWRNLRIKLFNSNIRALKKIGKPSFGEAR